MHFFWILVILQAINAHCAFVDTDVSNGTLLDNMLTVHIEERISSSCSNEEKPVTFYRREKVMTNIKRDRYKEYNPKERNGEKWKCAVIYIHGFQESKDSRLHNSLYKFWIEKKGCAAFAVEWQNGLTFSPTQYGCVLPHLPYVGRKVAEFIDSLITHKKVTRDQVHIIGFSLGAHVAGLAGRHMKSGTPAAIIGLDPAGPCFHGALEKYQLKFSDAKYVECIVTTPDFLGIGKHICTATFVVNGVCPQPGCTSANCGGAGSLLEICNHPAAIKVYERALEKNTYKSWKCPNHIKKLTSLANYYGECTQPTDIRMGDYKNIMGGVSGVFFTPTDNYLDGMYNNKKKQYVSPSEQGFVPLKKLENLVCEKVN